MVGGLAVRRRAGGVRMVGADSARRRVARDALAAARKRRVARSQYRRGARGAAPRRLCLSTRRRSAGRQGTAPVRTRVAGRSSASLRARRRLFDLRWEATRLRERPVLWSLLLVLSANLIVFWALAADAASGRLAVGHVVTFASAAVSTSMIAFGGLSWALDGAAAPADAVLRLRDAMASAGSARARRTSRCRTCRRARSVFAMSASRIPQAENACSTASI